MRFRKLSSIKGGLCLCPVLLHSSRACPRALRARRRVWIMGLAVGLGVGLVHLALAVVSGAAPEYVERGYAHVGQARVETDSVARERLLSTAIAAFKEAYQAEPPDLPSQVQALLGAAQAYLLVQSPHRVFPFLWQATPLQRAEKSLQQALVLQPDNAAAALLLGMVYWRQAAASEQQATRERSTYYLAQAAALGLPIAVGSASKQPESPVKLFRVEDTIMALRYIDARGVGRSEALLFVYQAAANAPLFGVVVVERQAYPLSTAPSTGALASHGLLESSTILPQPDQRPILVLRLRQDTQVQELRFTWDGTHFVPVSALLPR